MEDLEKLPLNNKVNRPDGGAYGERVELDRLKSALPSTSGGPGQGPSGPTPPPGQVRPTPVNPGAGQGVLGSGAAPSGVPDVLASPTKYPNRPVSTPYRPGGANPAAAGMGAANVQQTRLQVLDSLINSPNVGEETKEWAEIVRDALIYGSANG